jgi:hypothetical protein
MDATLPEMPGIRNHHHHSDLNVRVHTLSLGLLATLAIDATSQGVRAPRPVAPYIVAACPFECCVYGQWRFVTAADVRADPRRESPVVGRIEAGERVTARRGHVRIDTVGQVLVRRDFVDPDRNLSYRAGDTILVLDTMGEGYSHVWVRGERRELSMVHVLSQYGPAIGRDTAAMIELRPATSEWWANVVLPIQAAKDRSATRPRIGWVQMTADLDVRGADACGGPDSLAVRR